MAEPTSADPTRTRPASLASVRGRERGPAALPVALTSFVGREREVAAVASLLRRDDVRLLTLTGPGGVGKTRLAIAVATVLTDEFADGVHFIRLAPVRDPSVVLPTVAHALGLRESGDEPLGVRLHALLHTKTALLVLDNVEHVVDAAPLFAELLEARPQLMLLATSRVRLRLSGELEYTVPPLPLPDEHQMLPEEMLQAEAVRLFVERARTTTAAFALTAENAPAVANICHRLDGLPLAIELAAARIKVVPPPALLARLGHRLPLLIGGPCDQPARLQTMRDAIAWSYDLLEPREQALFRRLAVFVGGFTLEAAEEVAADASEPDMEVLDRVAALLDASLLRMEAGPERGPRYRMLETIREYGLERLAASGEADAVRRRHMEHFADLAEMVGTHAVWQPDPSIAFARLDTDLGNLRAALTWAAERGEVATLIRLAVGLQWSWHLHGGLSEGRAWVDRAVAVADTAPAPLRAAVLSSAAWLARHQGDLGYAEVLGEQSRALLREQGDALGESDVLITLGSIADDRGEFARSRALQEEGLQLVRPLNEPIRIAWALRHVGVLSDKCGDTPTAERLLAEALVLFRREGSRHGAAEVLSELAHFSLRRACPGGGPLAGAPEPDLERLGLSLVARSAG